MWKKIKEKRLFFVWMELNKNTYFVPIVQWQPLRRQPFSIWHIQYELHRDRMIAEMYLEVQTLPNQRMQHLWIQ